MIFSSLLALVSLSVAQPQPFLHAAKPTPATLHKMDAADLWDDRTAAVGKSQLLVARDDNDNKLPFYLQFHYSNDLIKVGDIDLFAAIWQTGFVRADATGVESVETYKVYGRVEHCVWEDSHPDLSVKVKLSGNWGQISNTEGWKVRDQLIITMWEMVQKVRQKDDTIWTDCRDCGIAGCSDNLNATCGLYRQSMCDCYRNKGGGGAGMDQCYGSRLAFKIPSEMTLTWYNADGSLRADSLTVSTSSHNVTPEKWHCGRMGAVIETIIQIVIPEFGKSLSDQVKIVCRAA